MAHPNALSATKPKATPPQNSFATPLTINDLDPDVENPDDWEYEYSTTETETFYVTLDLTTDDIAPPNHAKRSAGTGGAKAKWLNPALGRVKRKMAMDRSEEKAMKLRTNAIPSQTPRSEADIDDDAPGSPDGSGGSQREELGDDEASKIQILGLHSKNPIVSYNGNVFSCQWASNIGTELLFTECDPKSGLPVLRRLPGDVDLLAASSMRIISNSVTMEPKSVATQASTKKQTQKNKKPHSLSIPLGPKSSDERKGQAQFLEKLMNIKAAKGEGDDVTIYATNRLSRQGWRKHVVNRRVQERKALQRILGSHKPKDQKKHAGAKRRLAELDREDEMQKEAEKTWLTESRPQGMGRVRVVEREEGESSRKRARVDGGDSMEEASPRESLSTPTPGRWEENDGLFDGNDIEEDDENIEEGMVSEDENADEDAPGEEDDAPGEDEDTQLTYEWS